MSAGAKLGKVGLAPVTEIVDTPVRPLAPIRINLLPHREMDRERRKKDFISLAGLVGIAGAVAVFAGGFAINQQIASQQERNAFITTENARLDAEIAEVKTLRDEIAALKARQQAVENLQGDRTAPVRLFAELVRLTPEGVYLRQIKQEDMRVTLIGHAQTNERVAELLRNLAESSPLLERPELGEIKETTVAAVGGARDASSRKVYEFSLNTLMKRAAPPAEGKPDTPRTQGGEPVKLGALR
jgi:type IV pilus assembly protein PilN